MSLDAPRISPLGTTALLFEAPGEFDIVAQRRIWTLAGAAGRWPEVREAVPGMTNLMLLFEAPPADLAPIEARLVETWAECEPPTPESKTPESKAVEIDITYGGGGGPHLAEVAERTGLSIDDVVAIHSAPTYTVYAVGSHPGYCYLGGLDARLFLPRRAVPLLSIPGGSLSIAGMQTGVSASAGPSGWHTIGSTDATFFDPVRAPPALLAPGDTIRFRPARVIR